MITQISMFEDEPATNRKEQIIYNTSDALSNIKKLYAMWLGGELGGEFMPEDSNPNLDKSSEENFIYFTLPMALNYQRNSYKLWEAALSTYNDSDTYYLFDPQSVVQQNREKIQQDLLKYKVALQPNKHTDIWITICRTICDKFHCKIKTLFSENDYRVEKVLANIQKVNKPGFPYLSGNKIANYWLYVLTQYTDINFVDRYNISVAPDTHVIQSTYKLGLLKDINSPTAQSDTAKIWKELLRDTDLSPIDVHTPMWLWSRGGFKNIH